MQIQNGNFVFLSTAKVEPLAACSTFQRSNQRSQGRTTVGRKGWVEYKVPSMGYTDALLKMQYLCLGHRPLTLSVNGVVVSKDFAKASSGGFTENRHLKWTPAQRISGLNSEFVVRLETRGSFPNLACLKFELFNSEEKVEELVNQVRAKLSDGGFDAKKALACAEELVEYNQYVDTVPETRILKLFDTDVSEDTVSDSGESDEALRERRLREHAAARKEARRAMRAKKAALMRAKKQQPSEVTANADDCAAQRNRDRVAARMAARQQMRAKKAALQRAQKEQAASQDAEAAQRELLAKKAELLRAKQQEAARLRQQKREELIRARQEEAAILRQKKLAEMKARKQEAARARMAEREAALRKAAEEFEKEVDFDISAVMDWATSMGEKKMRNFVNQRATSENMTEKEVEMVMHYLICVYLKRVKKHKSCVPVHVTKSYTSTLLSLVDDYTKTGVFNALMQIEEEEEDSDSESGGAETESDSALSNVLNEQATAKEAKLLADHAQWVKEQEAKERARLAEEQQKMEVTELTNALCEELRDLVWDLREAQYFFEMTPEGQFEKVLMHNSFAHVESKISELENVNTSLVPEAHQQAIQAKLKAREEVGYLKTRFDHRTAGQVRQVLEGYATITRITTWTDKYVNGIAFEYSDGTKRCWGNVFSGTEQTTELKAQKVKTVHLWTTKNNKVAEGIRLFATNGIRHEAIGSKAKGMFGLGSPDQKLTADEEVFELIFSQSKISSLGGSRVHQVPQGSWLDEAEAYRWDGHVLVAHVSGCEPSRVVPLPRETFKFENGRMVVEKRLM